MVNLFSKSKNADSTDAEWEALFTALDKLLDSLVTKLANENTSFETDSFTHTS